LSNNHKRAYAINRSAENGKMESAQNDLKCGRKLALVAARSWRMYAAETSVRSSRG
jgi:hypothetical protein